MAISKVVVVDGNNLIVRIDRGVAGRGVTDVEPVVISGSLYLVFTFSDGTTETVGPIATIQYVGQAPIVVNGSTISLSTVPVNLGGTGQVTANAGFNALAPTQTGNSGKYLKTDGTNSAWDLIDISTADITGVLPLANGGTASSTASGARTNLGLGTIATQNASSVAITGGTITGITDLAVADGGTGSSTAAGAMVNLLPSYTGNANKRLGLDGTATGLEWVTDGGGTVTSVDVSGGTTGLSFSGGPVTTSGTITLSGTLDLDNGGTGATTAAGARTNLNAVDQATTLTAGTGLSGGGDLTTNRSFSITNTGVTAAAYGAASKTLTATVNAQGQLTVLADTPIAIANTQISGLGTMSTQNSNAVTITGGSITGITDLALADGGTGASNAPDARSNLGLGSAAVLNAGVALGVATLDAGGTVPLSQIPASIQGGVSYQGAWNASTNTPTLVSSVGSKGYYYVVAVAGNTNLNGVTDWLVGDWAIYNGTAWEKIDNTDQVASVNGYTGVVVLSNTDVGAPPTSLTISAGTGLSGGGSLAANRTLSIANTTVTAAPYGTASAVPTFTVNGQGQLTAASDVTIAIANTQVSGLGTMSTQNANSVAITGGSITGITDLAIADGGTGASNAPDARTNLGLGTIATQNASSVTITGGTINGTSIGATTASTGEFTSLTVNDNATFGSSNTDTATFTARVSSEFTPSSDNTYDLGRTGHEWRNLYLTGTGNIDSLIADTADINGGTIDATAIGSTTPSSGAFTTVTASTAIGIASGGTGQTTAAAAITALSGTQTSGYYLRSDGTNTSLAAIVAGDVPTLNQNTTGTAANITATTNTTLTTLSSLSLAGSQVTGNISGNAANVTGTVAIANGGTGVTTSTGTTNVVLSNSPTLVTPTLGVATATSLQGIIGNVTPAAGAFTSLTASTTLGVTGLSTLTAGALIEGLTVGRGAGAVATNTAVGASALAANTTGGFNTAVGNITLNTNLIGQQNVAVGHGSLSTNKSDYNVAVGVNALNANSTGANNTALGTNALLVNLASNNTAVGYQSQYTNQLGTYNTSVGYQSLYTSNRSDGASHNTAVGSFAGFYAASSSQLSLLGYEAGFYQTGSVHVAVGYQALKGASGTSTGNYNIAVGTQALFSATSGSTNVGVGYQAGYLTNSGSNNTALGTYTNYSNQTGNQSTAVGMYALFYNTNSYNTAVGYSAAINVTGTSNVAVGNEALQGTINLSTGNYNTALGSQALYSNRSAPSNTAVGYQAGYHFSGTSGLNTYVGTYAGYSSTGANTADYGNTFIGYAAGFSLANAGNSQTGIYNTFIGTSAGYDVTTGYKNTILGRYSGNQGGLDIRTANNYIVLSDGDGNPRCYWTTTGVMIQSISNTDNFVAQFVNSTATRPYGMYINFSAATPNNTTERFLQCSDSTNEKCTIFSSGTVTNRTGTYNAFSDIKLKQDVVDASSQWDDIKAVRVRKFRLKDDVVANPEAKPLIGVIAQELELTSAGLIDDCIDKEGDVTKSVKYSILYMKAIKALQEAMERIEQLEARLDAANL